MRIFLINILGIGVDLTVGKLSKEQINNWMDIESNKFHDTKPMFKFHGALAEEAKIEVIDDSGQLFDTYAYSDLMTEESDMLKLKSGSFYIKEGFAKGLFHQFELVLANDESFDVDMLTIQTKEYNGEQYIYSLLYDNESLESIDSNVTKVEEKIQKITC